MFRIAIPTVLLSLVCFAACGDTQRPSMDAAVALDSATPQRRDATPGDASFEDGGPADDAGGDAAQPTDAGPADSDGDGTPDASDCDPRDASIAETADRDCSNACGVGEELCREGVWGACSAPTDCLCDTPGETRLTACGNCGQMAEQCTDGSWVSTSECHDEGPCSPGATEMMDRGRCGVNQRICRMDCSWGDWAVLVPRGECSPYAFYCPVQRAGERRVMDRPHQGGRDGESRTVGEVGSRLGS